MEVSIVYFLTHGPDQDEDNDPNEDEHLAIEGGQEVVQADAHTDDVSHVQQHHEEGGDESEDENEFGDVVQLSQQVHQ